MLPNVFLSKIMQSVKLIARVLWGWGLFFHGLMAQLTLLKDEESYPAKREIAVINRMLSIPTV